jgi:hypothetical protein
MGGKNPFLGIAYVVVGGLCVVLGFVFTIAHLVKPRHVQSHKFGVNLKANSGTGNWEIIPICHGTITTQRQRESQLAEKPEQVHSMMGFQVDRPSQYRFRATILTRRNGWALGVHQEFRGPMRMPWLHFFQFGCYNSESSVHFFSTRAYANSPTLKFQVFNPCLELRRCLVRPNGAHTALQTARIMTPDSKRHIPQRSI